MVPLLLKTNIQAGQAAPLTNEGVRFFQCWFKIGCKLICNAWEAQSVCRGNNFTLLGIGEIPITVEVGWNQSSAVQPTTSVIAILVRNWTNNWKFLRQDIKFCCVAKYFNTNIVEEIKWYSEASNLIKVELVQDVTGRATMLDICWTYSCVLVLWVMGWGGVGGVEGAAIWKLTGLTQPDVQKVHNIEFDE